MKNKKIKLRYINNVARKDLLEIEVAENVQLEQLLLSFEPVRKEKCQSFDIDNFGVIITSHFLLLKNRNHIYFQTPQN